MSTGSNETASGNRNVESLIDERLTSYVLYDVVEGEEEEDEELVSTGNC
jgi:hypothetical protein